MTRLAIRPAIPRSGIEDAIERLLSLLDRLDGDPDFEPANDDEPSLGWPAGGPAQFGNSSDGRLDDDREVDNADWEDGGDSEPTLGAPEQHPHPLGCQRHDGSQANWAAGARGDHEREIDADIEQDAGEQSEGDWHSTSEAP